MVRVTLREQLARDGGQQLQTKRDWPHTARSRHPPPAPPQLAVANDFDSAIRALQGKARSQMCLVWGF